MSKILHETSRYTLSQIQTPFSIRAATLPKGSSTPLLCLLLSPRKTRGSGEPTWAPGYGCPVCMHFYTLPKYTYINWLEDCITKPIQVQLSNPLKKFQKGVRVLQPSSIASWWVSPSGTQLWGQHAKPQYDTQVQAPKGWRTTPKGGVV